MNKEDIRKLAYYFVSLVAVLTGLAMLTVSIDVCDGVVVYHVVPLAGAVTLFGIGGGLMIYIISRVYK